jgi:hypothetical protein
MTDTPRGDWWQPLPAAQATVACGNAQHAIRWQAGRLSLLAHPDSDAELVLAALGGTKPGCMQLADMWGRHVRDLDVLTLGPRHAADDITVGWDDVDAVRAHSPGRGLRPRTMPMMRPGAPVAVSAEEMERAWERQVELLSLFALGPEFRMRLAGTVAASWEGLPGAGRLPKVAAALAGRAGPAVAGWLGIDPGQVDVSAHEGTGWGSLELTGAGRGQRVRANLPVGWLARVWACGLAVSGGHLVVQVQSAHWPHARVLALPAPGAAPVTLDLRAVPPGTPEPGTPEPDTPEANTPGGEAHWVRSESSEEAGSR